MGVAEMHTIVEDVVLLEKVSADFTIREVVAKLLRKNACVKKTLGVRSGQLAREFRNGAALVWIETRRLSVTRRRLVSDHDRLIVLRRPGFGFERHDAHASGDDKLALYVAQLVRQFHRDRAVGDLYRVTEILPALPLPIDSVAPGDDLHALVFAAGVFGLVDVHELIVDRVAGLSRRAFVALVAQEIVESPVGLDLVSPFIKSRRAPGYRVVTYSLQVVSIEGRANVPTVLSPGMIRVDRDEPGFAIQRLLVEVVHADRKAELVQDSDDVVDLEPTGISIEKNAVLPVLPADHAFDKPVVSTEPSRRDAREVDADRRVEELLHQAQGKITQVQLIRIAHERRQLKDRFDVLVTG